MYQFSGWCFLCAEEKNVDVQIQQLDEPLREDIGQFSIINFTLTGVPSKICLNCLEFLEEYERRKERYASVEQMFMELIKMKNKAVDIPGIRSKYKLDQEPPEPPVNDFIQAVEDFEVPSEPSAVIPPVTQPPTLPKLLNPTIHPKIFNTTRLPLFKCDLCSHTSSTKSSIDRHMMQIHLKVSSNAFECKTCSKTFAKKIILQNHEKIHMNQRPVFACEQCGKVLSSQTAVANHVKWIHKAIREFKCGSCEKMFATKGSLKEHEKIHSNFKGHVCAICSKSYKTASTLTQHLDTHGETEYHCTECGLRLNSKRTLKQHMLKHSDVVRYTCEICNAQFKRPKAYKEHLISQHTQIKAYDCDWCGKKFSNGANCRKHKKDAHPDELAEADKKEFKKIVKLPKIDELVSLSWKQNN